MAQTIFFDESGFTGNNLLNHDQPFFAYCSVSTDETEVQKYVEDLRRTHRFQGELKGAKLIRNNPNAASEILFKYQNQCKISISNKKFALCCKFFEYLIEPVIAARSSDFYGVEFHKFISNLLYFEAVYDEVGAGELIKSFEKLMRDVSPASLNQFFNSVRTLRFSEPLSHLIQFAEFHLPLLNQEIFTLAECNVGRWVLDITNTSLYCLLAAWGAEYEQITAICDKSLPLGDQSEDWLINGMIQNQRKEYLQLVGDRLPLTFNLSGPVAFINSRSCSSIQVADVISRMSVIAFTEDSQIATEWREIIVGISGYGSMFPEPTYLSNENKNLKVHSELLYQLYGLTI